MTVVTIVSASVPAVSPIAVVPSVSTNVCANRADLPDLRPDHGRGTDPAIALHPAINLLTRRGPALAPLLGQLLAVCTFGIALRPDQSFTRRAFGLPLLTLLHLLLITLHPLATLIAGLNLSFDLHLRRDRSFRSCGTLDTLLTLRTFRTLGTLGALRTFSPAFGARFTGRLTILVAALGECRHRAAGGQ